MELLGRHALAQERKHWLPRISTIQTDIFEKCLKEAQRIASESVSYIGAKRLIHH